jgi:hypothetical protein
MKKETSEKQSKEIPAYHYDPAPCLRLCGSDGSHVCNDIDGYGYANPKRSDTCDAYKAWRKRYLGIDRQ